MLNDANHELIEWAEMAKVKLAQTLEKTKAIIADDSLTNAEYAECLEEIRAILEELGGSGAMN